MKQIRQSVFETNSSSIHALCISKAPVKEKDYANHVNFNLDNYGWEFYKYDTMQERANYLYTAASQLDYRYHTDYVSRIEGMLSLHGITYSFNPVHDKYFDGVDHYSCLQEFIDDITKNDDKLMRFLFGKSIIVTGNDNDELLGPFFGKYVDKEKYDVFNKWN